MLTTIKTYEDFLIDSWNEALKDNTENVYKYAFIRLKHDLVTFKEHNGHIHVPDAFFTPFLDWWNKKEQDERKTEIN